MIYNFLINKYGAHIGYVLFLYTLFVIRNNNNTNIKVFYILFNILNISLIKHIIIKNKK